MKLVQILAQLFAGCINLTSISFRINVHKMGMIISELLRGLCEKKST